MRSRPAPFRTRCCCALTHSAIPHALLLCAHAQCHSAHAAVRALALRMVSLSRCPFSSSAFRAQHPSVLVLPVGFSLLSFSFSLAQRPTHRASLLKGHGGRHLARGCVHGKAPPQAKNGPFQARKTSVDAAKDAPSNGAHGHPAQRHRPTAFPLPRAPLPDPCRLTLFSRGARIN